MSTWSQEYYRSILSGQARRYYSYILSGLSDMKEYITIPRPMADMDAISDAFNAVNMDHPELFWVDGYSGYRCISGPAMSGLQVNNFYARDEIVRWKAETESWRYRICSQIPPSADEYRRIWMIYDYLARQVEYGHSEAKYSQTIIGCMKRGFHHSVCEGIAKSFKYLCDYEGINSIVIFGEMDTGMGYRGHAWNLVECNRHIYHVDATAALQEAKFYGKAETKGFLKSSAEMKDYIWDL